MRIWPDEPEEPANLNAARGTCQFEFGAAEACYHAKGGNLQYAYSVPRIMDLCLRWVSGFC